MTDNPKGGKSPGEADRLFGKLSGWLGRKISTFVAFLFLLFAAGAFYGSLIVPRAGQWGALLLIAPLALALVAYYNRGVAVILFMGIALVFIL
jgi:low affinity Fe/Cu permease